MREKIATYILKNDKNETIAEFESNIPAKDLQEYLKQNNNRFNKESFIKFVNSFKTVINKFSVMI